MFRRFVAVLLSAAFLFTLTACAPILPGSSSPAEEGGFSALDKPLDEIFSGAKTGENDLTVPVSEDAYVQNGSANPSDTANVRYGAAETLEVKGDASNGKLHRITYLKFDLTQAACTPFSVALLKLYCISSETTDPVPLFVYETSSEWSENTITYNNRPADKEKIGETDSGGKGYVCIDLTDAVQEAVDEGKSVLSLAVKNDGAPTNRRLIFDSKEKEDGVAPQLYLSDADISFYTDIECNGAENPWKNAQRIVNEWFVRQQTINETVGASNSAAPARREEEYALSVDAAKAADTNGDDTKYTSYPTRTVETLSGYTYNAEEKEDYDAYGGYTKGGKYAATGYFYIKKLNGRWWTIDPLGYPYYHVGMVSITEGNLDGYEALRNIYPTTESWAEGQTRYLKDELGFNSAGGWSNYSALTNAQKPLSQTTILNFAAQYGKEVHLNNTTGGSTTFVGGCMPVFDPDFIPFCRERAQRLVSPYADDPAFYGWMLDNELEASVQMLDNFMNLSPASAVNAYSYAVVWTFLYAHLHKGNIQPSDITDGLRKEFRAFVYDRYFSVAVPAVKAYDSNHMILGCRFLSGCYKDESVMKVAGYWNDVLTFNYYNVWTPDLSLLANIHNWSGKPVMITEWYAKGMDACTAESGLTNRSGAGWTVRTQSDRGNFYHNYALALMESKYCVGFDWFKMWDNNPADTSADTSNTNANKGIYNIHYEPYTDLTDRMAYLNNNKYSLVSFFDGR